MNELSLFSGAGGGLLGTHLLGWKHIGYVEFNDYCQRVIAARIKDGILPVAPIFGDVRAFISEGYAASYTGLVDVISGGFPCQPFSVAGKRAGADDERNMWPATRDCVRIIRPRYCFFENVPGLLNSGYFGTIIRDLAESGYCVRWRILSAAEMGAPHKRDRLWIVANSNSRNDDGWTKSRTRRPDGFAIHGKKGTVADVADANGNRFWNGQNKQECKQGSCGTSNPSNDGKKEFMGNTGSARLSQSQHQRQYAGSATESNWWAVEPNVGRVADELADWLDLT
jgi:DNA (cytosine-5)-methyltransferase 1